MHSLFAEGGGRGGVMGKKKHGTVPCIYIFQGLKEKKKIQKLCFLVFTVKTLR